MIEEKNTEKFNNLFKGDIKDLINFFNENIKGEDFETAFMGRKRLKIKEELFSYDFIYRLYRSIDGKYVLFGRDI